MASLIFLAWLVGAHRLDQSDGADGDQVLDVDPVFSNRRAMYTTRRRLCSMRGAEALWSPWARRWMSWLSSSRLRGLADVAAPDVHELSRLPQPEAGQPPAQGPAPAGPRFLHPHSSCHCVFTPPRRR